MRAADFVRQTLRPIRHKWLESLLIVLTIVFGVGMMTGFTSLIRMNSTSSINTKNKLEYRELQLETAGHEAEPDRSNYTPEVISELAPTAKALPKASMEVIADTEYLTKV